MKYLIETPYRMVKYPEQKYAYNYCKSNGLVLGESYYLSKTFDGDSVFISINVENKSVDIGIEFFKSHFKIDLRIINLKTLLL